MLPSAHSDGPFAWLYQGRRVTKVTNRVSLLDQRAEGKTGAGVWKCLSASGASPRQREIDSPSTCPRNLGLGRGLSLSLSRMNVMDLIKHWIWGVQGGRGFKKDPYISGWSYLGVWWLRLVK